MKTQQIRSRRRQAIIRSAAAAGLLVGLLLVSTFLLHQAPTRSNAAPASPEQLNFEARVLVYGDSNTRGVDGTPGGYYRDSQRWPSLLSARLQDPYSLKQAGRSGRFAGNLDTTGYKSGQQTFSATLRDATPVDFVVIALGTNDIRRTDRTAEQVYGDLQWYQRRVNGVKTGSTLFENGRARVVYLGLADNLADDTPALSAKAIRLNQLLRESGVRFVEVGELELVKDRVHYSRSDHLKVAGLLYDALMQAAPTESVVDFNQTR